MPSLARKIASASTQLTLSRASVRVLSLLTMPILTHLLPPSAYGIMAMAGTLIALLSVFVLAGMDMSYMRSFNDKFSENPFEQVEIFAWRYILIAGGLAALVLFFVWPQFASLFTLPHYLGPYLGAGIFLSLINTMGQTRARLNSQYGLLSATIFSSGIAAAIVSLGVAYWWRQDEMALLLSMLVAYSIPGFILGGPALLNIFKRSGILFSEQKAIMKIGLAGIVTAPTYWLISSSDRWLLGYFESADSVGIYSVGFSVGMMGMVINNAIHAVWTPEVVNEFNNHPDTAQTKLGLVTEKIICAFGCLSLAVVAAGGDTIRFLAAPVFHEGADIIPFIAVAVFFHGVTHLAKASLLLMKQLYYSMWCYIAGGVFCLGANFLLIPLLGRTGAAMTQALSMAVIAISISWFAHGIYPLQIRWPRLLLILTGLLLSGIIMTPPWSIEPLLSLGMKLPVGIIIVLLVIMMNTPELIITLYKRLIPSGDKEVR